MCLTVTSLAAVWCAGQHEDDLAVLRKQAAWWRDAIDELRQADCPELFAVGWKDLQILEEKQPVFYHVTRLLTKRVGPFRRPERWVCATQAK